MIAFKGFNLKLQCTLGRGTYQYEVGKTYHEEKCKCANSGFHCVEEPIEVLRWYPNGRWCIVKAAGDINGCEDKIACTEMTIIKELTKQELGMQECVWLQAHPNREYSSKVERDTGMANKGDIVVVRGKNPRAAGDEGSTIFLLREEKETNEIEEIGVFQIDGEEYKPSTYYRVDGRKCRCAKKK